MNYTKYKFSCVFPLVWMLLLFSTSSHSSSSPPILSQFGFRAQTVSLTGQNKIGKGKVETYTINIKGVRKKEHGIDPATTNISTAVEIWDKDGYFRGDNDLLLTIPYIITKGADGSVFSTSMTFKLKCTNNKKIRVPDEGKSGEKEAEVFAWFSGKGSTIKKVRCK